MSTTTLQSRIARTRTRLASVRLSIKLLVVGIVADAATTVYGISIMGMVYETGSLASELIPWLWASAVFGLNLGEAAGVYAYGYVLVGLCIAATLQYLDTNAEFQEIPGVKWVPPVFASIFAISPLVNLYVLAKWIAFVPNAGWVLSLEIKRRLGGELREEPGKHTEVIERFRMVISALKENIESQ